MPRDPPRKLVSFSHSGLLPENDKSLIEPFLQVDGDYSHAFQITGTKPRAPTLEGKGKGTLTLIKQWKDKGELMGRNSL